MKLSDTQWQGLEQIARTGRVGRTHARTTHSLDRLGLIERASPGRRLTALGAQLLSKRLAILRPRDVVPVTIHLSLEDAILLGAAERILNGNPLPSDKHPSVIPSAVSVIRRILAADHAARPEMSPAERRHLLHQLRLITDGKEPTCPTRG